MSKTLIACFSRAGENYFGGELRRIKTGNTEMAARMIAEFTGGALYKIEPAAPYSEQYMACIEKAKKDLQSRARPALAAMPESLDAYDEIYLGYPNYWGTMPMAVYTFLEAFDFTGKTIHPFCTHEGSGLGGTERDVAAAARGAKVTKGLAIPGHAVCGARAQIESWCKAK